MTRASERCNFDHIKNYAKGSQINQLSQSRFQYPLRISKGYPMVLLTIGIGINENRTLPPKFCVIQDYSCRLFCHLLSDLMPLT